MNALLCHAVPIAKSAPCSAVIAATTSLLLCRPPARSPSVPPAARRSSCSGRRRRGCHRRGEIDGDGARAAIPARRKIASRCVTPDSSSSANGRDIGELLGRDPHPQRLPFAYRTAYTLMEIAADRRIVQHVAQMPPSWGTLYHLTKLDDAQFTKLLKSGVIRPDLERHEIICCAMPSRSHRPTRSAAKQCRRRRGLHLERADQPRLRQRSVVAASASIIAARISRATNPRRAYVMTRDDRQRKEWSCSSDAHRPCVEQTNMDRPMLLGQAVERQHQRQRGRGPTWTTNPGRDTYECVH